MSRRGNSEGTITKRKDGRWEARVSLPNGKRKSLYGKSKADVVKKLTEARHAETRGLLARDERQTLARFLETWQDKMRHTVKQSTWLRYQQHLAHLPPEMKRTPIARLTPQQVQGWYSQLLSEGLSTTTVHHMHTVLHHVLRDALRLGVVPRNVTEDIDPPRPRRTDMQVLNETQARQFLAACAGTRFEALFVLAITTGMRQGELLGLSWQDVDLEAGVIAVHTSMRYMQKQFVFTDPKTSHSRRRIRLSSLALEALKRQRELQDDLGARYSRVWNDQYNLVFTNHLGGPINFANLLYFEFQPLLKKAGLPKIRFHDLRHTAATLLLKQGVHVKIVSELLGHSSVSITLDRYSHVLPDMQDIAAKAMEHAFLDVLSSQLSSSKDEQEDES